MMGSRHSFHCNFVASLCALAVLANTFSFPAFSKESSNFRMIMPEKVVAGESFTGLVVKDTPNGMVPLNKGDQCVFQGKVIDVQKGGKVKLPPLATIAGAASIALSVLQAGGAGGAEETACPSQALEVVNPPTTPTPTISQTSNIVSNGSPFTVSGQNLNNIKNPALQSADGKQIPLGKSVGSSQQRIFPNNSAKQSIPKGSYTFVAQDQQGNQIKAPNQSTNPRLKITGDNIQKKGQRGKLTLQSESAANLVLKGGQPQIQLDQMNVNVEANQPASIGFTALQVGPYNVSVTPTDPELPQRPTLGIFEKIAEGEEEDDEGDEEDHGEVAYNPKTQERPQPVPIPPLGAPPENPQPHAPDEPELISNDEYGIKLERVDDDWIPMEKFNGNWDHQAKDGVDTTKVIAKIYRRPKGTKEWIFPGPKRRIIFEINSSTEPGQCLNSKNSDTTNDIFVDVTKDAQIIGMDEDPRHLKVKTKGVHNEKKLTLSCEDFGAFSKVTAKTEEGDCEIIPTQPVTVPRDDKNNNDIADHWEDIRNFDENDPEGKEVDADKDREKEPAGKEGTEGDGLTCYEEYRGFRCQGVHYRTSLSKKDLFICTPDAFLKGVEFFQRISDIVCHVITAEEYGGNKKRVINFNKKSHSQYFEQHGVLIKEVPMIGSKSINKDTGKEYTPEELAKVGKRGASGRTVPRKGPPIKVELVQIDSLNTAQSNYDMKKVVAHELGHVCGIDHHGDGLGYPKVVPADFYPDGGLWGYVKDQEFWINEEEGTSSGDWNCLIRYPAMGTVGDKSSCPGVFSGKPYKKADYGFTWLNLCDNNGAEDAKNKDQAGPCQSGRGSCRKRLVVNDLYGN